ncbi:chaperonin 10-like protein [Rhexocercosporidium sp. MPI-PUGE-AT-0058]|nr:chaperonin 10-like protein [Rhexocercosporidium sp. MPI-PUGE-AT-0058]
MSTHAAVVTASIGGPLKVLQVPTVPPTGDEVQVKVQWTASTPLDLHQNDGGLLVTHPQVLGDGTAGTVVRVGDGVRRLRVGDKVFGFTWRTQKEKAHQEYCTAPEYFLAKLPANFSLQEAITLPNNFVTVFHSLTTDLSLSLPWPRPENYIPEHAATPILIWGGSSSVGQYALQILKYYGYTNLLTTSSTSHHSLLKSYGAKDTFDYRSPEIVPDILAAVPGGKIPFILDCIGSKYGSLAPLARIAKEGSRVAILLPVILKDAGEGGVKPEYSMDVRAEAEWEVGVEARGVRTHFYLENPLFKEKLQPEIMPTLLAEGVVKPNRIRIVEGETLLERAQRAMDALRRKEVSGERLVWRVSDE